MRIDTAFGRRWSYPFLVFHVQSFHLSVLEIAREANPVVGQMWLVANDNDIIFSPLRIELQEFFAVTLGLDRPPGGFGDQGALT
jgi:hypothetical protein